MGSYIYIILNFIFFMAGKNKASVLPFVYLVLGIYFLSFGLDYLSVPDFVVKINNWIIAFGGIMFFVAFYRSIVYSKSRIAKKLFKSANASS